MKSYYWDRFESGSAVLDAERAEESWQRWKPHQPYIFGNREEES